MVRKSNLQDQSSDGSNLASLINVVFLGLNIDLHRKSISCLGQYLY